MKQFSKIPAWVRNAQKEDVYLLNPAMLTMLKEQADNKDIILVWTNIGRPDTDNATAGFRGFDFWTDAKKHMDEVRKTDEFTQFDYYFYIVSRQEIIKIS